MNYHKHNWKCTNTQTLTLDAIFEDYNDFALISGIDTSVKEYETIYNQLYNLYGDTDTIDNTVDYVASRLRFSIENKFELYQKQNEIWDGLLEKLYGEYEEINQFDIGELKGPGEIVDENYDQYKFARQTKSKTQDVLDKIKEIQDMRTPFENLIHDIANEVFQAVIPERYLL